MPIKRIIVPLDPCEHERVTRKTVKFAMELVKYLGIRLDFVLVENQDLDGHVAMLDAAVRLLAVYDLFCQCDWEIRLY